MFVPSLSWQNDGVFIYKWLKSAVFSQAAVHAEGIQRNMVRKRIWSPHFAPLSFYQDRLGTNIRKGSTLKKRERRFCRGGRGMASSDWACWGGPGCLSATRSLQTSTGKKTPSLRHFITVCFSLVYIYIVLGSIYHDRLGTNIGKALKKSDAFADIGLGTARR
jgi:hypothetical protein